MTDSEHQAVALVGTDVPQADRLESVVDHVRRMALAIGEPSGEAVRQQAYLDQAARILHWVQPDGDITEAGGALARTFAGPETLAFCRASFERTAVYGAWCEYCHASSLADLVDSDPEPFLIATGALAPSTAHRRARTLAAWLKTLRPTITEPPPSLPRLRQFLDGCALPPHAARFLDELLGDRVPTRMSNWAGRNGVTTFGELLQRSREAMLSERHLGRRSIAQTEEVILQATGLGWERLRELLGILNHGTENAEGSAPTQESSWDGLEARCPGELTGLPIDRVALPKRFVSQLCRVHDIRTLGELLRWKHSELRKVPKLGQKSIVSAKAAIDELFATYTSHGAGSASNAVQPPASKVEELPDLLTHVKARVGKMEPVDRLAWRRRAGLHGATSTLEEVGQMLGVSRERARQLEKRATARLASEWWVPLVGERIADQVGDNAFELAELGERDDFFASIVEQPEFFDYLLQRVFESEVRLVEIGDARVLAKASPKEVRDALADMRADARRLEFPLPWLSAMELAVQHAEFAPCLEPHFQRELASHLAKTTDTAGMDLAVGYGWGLTARVLQFLEASEGPVTRAELEDAVGRWPKLPDQVIYVARGVMALPKHVPNFEVWSRRLVPLCKTIMRQEDPGRQWSAAELFEAVGERAQLPEWFGHWHLASMLRLSGEVRYLGRLQVALDHDEAPEERRLLHEIIVELLEKEGAPMEAEDITHRVQEVRGGREGSIATTLNKPPFFEVSAGVVGLAPRDVPGGAQALAAAVTAIEAELENRQRGLGAAEALQVVRAVSAAHAPWTIEMVKSLIRSQSTLRLNRSGGIGLADWDDDRLPTRRQMIAAMVEEAGGELALDSAADQIEAVFGTRPGRVQVANIAYPEGLHVRDGCLVSEEAMLAGTTGPADLPDPAELPGFPRPAIPIFRDLLQEPERDLVVLRRESLAYVKAFEQAAVEQPHIEPAEARAAAAAVARLVDTMSEDPSRTERLLIQAAARYFLISEDAESDFAVGGLDDDIEVIDAVASYLSRPDCRVQLPKVEHRPPWVSQLPDEGARRLFEHLRDHGVVTEPEAAFMLGSQRAARRFARRFDDLVQLVPFDVKIDVIGGVKRYVRQEQ